MLFKKMKSLYIPKDIYDALEQDVGLSIKQVMAIQGTPYSTAARYRTNFKLIKDKPKSYSVRHTKHKVDIGGYRKINMQRQQMDELLKDLLNQDGFASTAHLRELYYSRYSTSSSVCETQSRRNFNRYFKAARESLEVEQYKLEIYRSSNNKTGFCTRQNAAFKPTDY